MLNQIYDANERDTEYPKEEFIYDHLPDRFRPILESRGEFWDLVYSDFQTEWESRNQTRLIDITHGFYSLYEQVMLKPTVEQVKKLLPLFYTIGTTTPLVFPMIQIQIFNLFSVIYRPTIHKGVRQSITLDWKRVYKFLKATVFSNIYDNMETSVDASNFFETILRCSFFFPKEATNDILQKYLKKFSPRGLHSSMHVMISTFMIPVHYGNYNTFIFYYLEELKTPFVENEICAILDFFSRIVRWNIHDDFSFLVQTAMMMLNHFIISPSDVDFITPCTFSPFIHEAFQNLEIDLSKLVALLFYSPKSRSLIIDQLTKALLKAQYNVHPARSTEKSALFPEFVHYLVTNIDSLSVSFKMDPDIQEFLPNDKEIEIFLTPIVDSLITFVHTFSLSDIRTLGSSISFISRHNSNFTKRFFNYAIQCLSEPDVEDVANHGWCICFSITKQLGKSGLLKENYQKLFDLAVESLHKLEEQKDVARFLRNFIDLSPLNPETSLVQDDFESFGIRLIQAVLDIGRNLPVISQKLSQVPKSFSDSISALLRVFFVGSSKDVIHALLPILLSAINDQSLHNAVFFLSDLFSLFSIHADKSYVEQLISLLSHNIETCKYIPSIRFYLYIYAFTIKTFYKTVDEMKAGVSCIVSLLSSPIEKMHKNAWNGLAFAFFNDLTPFVQLYSQEKSLSYHPHEFIADQILPNPDFSLIAFEIVKDKLEFLLSSTSPTEVYKTLKPLSVFLEIALMLSPTLLKGTFEPEVPFMLKSPFYLESNYSDDNKLVSTILYVCVRLMEAFEEHPKIFAKSLIIFQSYFQKQSQSFPAATNQPSILVRDGLKIVNKFKASQLFTTAFAIFRKNRLIPFTPVIKKGFLFSLKAGFSSFSNIREISSNFFKFVPSISPTIFDTFFLDLDLSKIPSDELLFFTDYRLVKSTFKTNPKVFAKFSRYFVNEFVALDQGSDQFLFEQLDGTFSQKFFETAPSNNPEINNLLLQLPLDKGENKSFLCILCLIIGICIRFVEDVPDQIRTFLIDQCTSPDIYTQQVATSALGILFQRQCKPKSEKVLLSDLPKPGPLFEESEILIFQNLSEIMQKIKTDIPHLPNSSALHLYLTRAFVLCISLL
jgi:hypothetical protein